MKPQSNFSISSSTSISLLPSHENTSRNLNTAELNLFFESKPRESQLHNIYQLSDKVFQVEEDPDTVQEYLNLEEEAPTIRVENSVLCINCYEKVDLDEIDAHSYECLKPVRERVKVKEKIKEYLAWIREFRSECREVYVYPLFVLEDFAKTMLGLKAHTEAIDLFQKLNLFAEEFKNLPSVMMAAERLTLLVEALSVDETSDFDDLDSNQQFVDGIETSRAAEFGLSDLEFSDFLDGNKKTNIVQSSEALEKCFYSQYIKIKLNSEAQIFPSMFDLYEICKSQKIPQSSWSNFIKSYFN